MEQEVPKANEAVTEARRKFLASCGKFALVTPPAVALLLSSAERNFAVASSGGGRSHDHDDHDDDHHEDHDFHGNNGFGNGGHDGVPGHSGKEDNDR